MGGSDSAYQPVAIGEFTASVNHAKSLGDVWIDTVLNVAAYWRAQKMFSAIDAGHLGEFEDMDVDPARALPAREGPARQSRRRHADSAGRTDADLGRSRLL